MTGILMMSVGNSYGYKPVNTVAPAVTGTATFGQTLSCSTGTWDAAPPSISYTYQWYRSPSTSIGGATSSTYVLVAADVGNTIYCTVTATNAVGVTSANSNTTSTVAATVPGAPTIGTATATSSTTATVSYTAPASNGGATITLYTATASPGGATGTLSTSGSGTITVSGLTAATSYSFTVKATNSIGQSAASSASNTIATQANPGQVAYETAGTYTWVAPAGVSLVSAVAVGASGGGPWTSSTSTSSPGAGLRYVNNYPVTPGGSYTVVVGAAGTVGTSGSPNGTAGGNSSVFSITAYGSPGGVRCSTAQLCGVGGSGGCGGGTGGTVINPGGGTYNYQAAGGAAGYTGNGGNGTAYSSASGTFILATCGAGGGGGGGGNSSLCGGAGAGGGGGVGILGQGANGTAGPNVNNSVAGGGSGGGCGGAARRYDGTFYRGGNGGVPGGGAGRSNSQQPGGNGARGAVRIMWYGGRSYPNNAGNL